MLLDKSWIPVPCPRCSYTFDIQLLDARLQSTVFCHNCKRIISLVDNNVEVYRVVKEVNDKVNDFIKAIKKIK